MLSFDTSIVSWNSFVEIKIVAAIVHEKLKQNMVSFL